MADNRKTILEVDRLRVEFRDDSGGSNPVVRDVSFTLKENETLAVVGESGSGKSMTALSVMGLLPKPAGRIASGSIRFQGTELVGMAERELDDIRGNEIAMIFQEPMTALNPSMRIGDQIGESLRKHRGMNSASARAESLRLLESVKIPSASSRIGSYPHQFSGGMRQRVMIAMALACRPKLLIADEPTTALDVTIQAQVLGLLEDLKRDHGLSILFITHNLGVVALIADRVAVMYAGEVVESGEVLPLFESPAHPYTRALLRSMPRIDRSVDRLEPISGNLPSVKNRGVGCAFAPRCSVATERCRIQAPPLHRFDNGQSSLCWLSIDS